MDLVPLLVVALAFLSAAGIAVFVAQRIADNLLVQKRLVTQSGGEAAANADSTASHLLSSLTKAVDEKKFGVEGPFRVKLKRELIRAGYFSEDALRYYVFARLGLVVLLPALVFIIVRALSGGENFLLQMMSILSAVVVGLFGVDAFISRRQSTLQYRHRTVFPDLIDMLVVCVDAGLSLDAAFARVTPEIGRRSKTLEMNLQLLGAETRAGRGLAEALSSLAERLNLDEVRAFAILLRQSIELGTDVADALRVFGDEMRQKRLLRAEEMANKLPVKMTLPLGMFIFPTVLMVVLVPVVIRLLYVFHTY